MTYSLLIRPAVPARITCSRFARAASSSLVPLSHLVSRFVVSKLWEFNSNFLASQANVSNAESNFPSERLSCNVPSTGCNLRCHQDGIHGGNVPIAGRNVGPASRCCAARTILARTHPRKEQLPRKSGCSSLIDLTYPGCPPRPLVAAQGPSHGTRTQTDGGQVASNVLGRRTGTS